MNGQALVTGGAGFIGSHLCQQLLNKGCAVTALDNLSVGTKENLDDFSSNKKFKLVIGDIRDEKLANSLVKKVDIVYHLAAVVGVSVVVEKPLETIDVNVVGTQVVTQACHRHNKKIVFASSSEVYGKNSQVPLDEDRSESIIGSTKISRWSYALTKALGEHLLFGYAEKGLPIAIVRYFNCYGPRGVNSSYANVIPRFIDQALNQKPITVHGNGKAARCFCYVTDTVLGTLSAGEKLDNDFVNIGSNSEIAIESLAKKIVGFTNSQSKIKHIPEKKIFTKKYESATRRVPSIKKAKKLLGFKPKVKLEEGLKKTIKWTKKNQ